MKVHDNIRFMRIYKDWTQEEMANKLGISTVAYAKIERGETDINLSRLEQIAEVMEIDLTQLFGLNEKNVFNFTSSQFTQFQNVNSLSTENPEHKYKLEKAQLINEQLKTENDFLKQNIELLKLQNSEYRDIINLLKEK